jgi:hypothetical protein
MEKTKEKVTAIRRRVEATLLYALAKAMSKVSVFFTEQRKKRGKYKPSEIIQLAHGLISEKEKTCRRYRLIGIKPVPQKINAIKVRYQVQYHFSGSNAVTREEEFVLDGPIWPMDFSDDVDFLNFMAGKPYGKKREKAQKLYDKAVFNAAKQIQRDPTKKVLIRSPEGKLLQLYSAKKD